MQNIRQKNLKTRKINTQVMESARRVVRTFFHDCSVFGIYKLCGHTLLTRRSYSFVVHCFRHAIVQEKRRNETINNSLVFIIFEQDNFQRQAARQSDPTAIQDFKTNTWIEPFSPSYYYSRKYIQLVVSLT